MPYTDKQRKLFRAAAHNPKIAEKHDMTMGQARRLMNEGQKHGVKSKKHPGQAY